MLLVCTGMSQELWNGVTQNQEDLSYMFDDEATPVKACGDFAYHVNSSGKPAFFIVLLLICATCQIVFPF